MNDTKKRRVQRGGSLRSRLGTQIRSPHVQLALAVGSSILAMAIASRWLLPKPIGYLAQAFPPFLAVIYESVYAKRPDAKICTPWYWIVAIVLATALVIALHMP